MAAPPSLRRRLPSLRRRPHTSTGVPVVACCGRVLVWNQEDGWWMATCASCLCFFAWHPPDPDLQQEELRRHLA